MGQEPYKGDIFKLFKDAYINNYFEGPSTLKADAIRDTLLFRWSAQTEGRDEEKLHMINEWTAKWDE